VPALTCKPAAGGQYCGTVGDGCGNALPCGTDCTASGANWVCGTNSVCVGGSDCVKVACTTQLGSNSTAAVLVTIVVGR